MKLLILTAFYPIPGQTHERMFIHIRNMYYVKVGLDVTVLNFAAKECYTIEGIPVITLADYEKTQVEYDILVTHSANLRNHYLFLQKYEKRFQHLVFFFHGHEILFLNHDYPQAYDYMPGKRMLRRWMQEGYDWLKITLWRAYYKKLAVKSDFVFVSRWLLDHYKKNARITEAELGGHVHIIHNSIGSAFETSDYDLTTPRQYDYITIRSNLDGSKYCIDEIVRLAERNPSKRFLIVGKGAYFAHCNKPNNVDWLNATLEHKDMEHYLNRSRCALMPTRQDTQGVMTCELAAFGMPVITSDIEVCHEFLNGRPNVAMISHDVETVDLQTVYERLAKHIPCPKDTAYFAENTVAREIDLYKAILASCPLHQAMTETR